MVPMPGAGGSALERNLRFLVLLREREEEIELYCLQKTLSRFMDRELYYGMKERPPNCKIVVESLLQVDSHE